MDRPGSEAVGIGAEADAKNSELFASAERWRRTLEALRAALRVATITQWTCSSIHIAAPSSQVFALLLLKPRHSIQGYTPLAISDGRKYVLHGFRKRLSDIHSFALLLTCQNEQHTLLGPSGYHFFQVESTGDDLSLTSIADKVASCEGGHRNGQLRCRPLSYRRNTEFRTSRLQGPVSSALRWQITQFFLRSSLLQCLLPPNQVGPLLLDPGQLQTSRLTPLKKMKYTYKSNVKIHQKENIITLIPCGRAKIAACYFFPINMRFCWGVRDT